MAYEREAISQIATPNAPVATPPPLMKEERVVSPYGRPKPKLAQANEGTPLPPATAEAPSTGQIDKVGEEESEETKSPEESVKLSPQLAALARKEQRFRQQQQALEKERLAIEAEKTELAQLKAMKEKLAAKDYSGLEELGVDYNEYSQYQINKLNGSDPVQSELKKLNDKVSEIEKSAQDQVTKQFEAAVNERRLAAKELIEKSTEFPRLKKAGATEAVVKHILDTWEHDSKELSIEQAAKEVEEVLVEQAKEWAALLEDDKEVADATPDEEKKPLPPLKAGLKTLTNQVTAGELKRTPKPYHTMSDSERWAEARKRAEEKLQQGIR